MLGSACEISSNNGPRACSSLNAGSTMSGRSDVEGMTAILAIEAIPGGAHKARSSTIDA